MKRYMVGGALCVAMLAQVGCSSNTLDKEAQNVISQMNAAANKIGNIAAAVKDAVKTAETKKKKTVDFAKAKEELKSLDTTAKSLLEVDNTLPRNLTDEQKKKVKEQFGQQAEAALGRVHKESEELRKTVAMAAAIDEKATKEFREELTSTLNQFTQIAARHD